MLLDISLFAIFFVSTGIAWRRIALKLPELARLSDSVITEQFKTESAKVRLILFHFKIFWRERHYHDLFLNAAGKILYQTHIVLLRLDNSLMGVLQKIRGNGGFAPDFTYWKRLKKEEEPASADAPRVPEAQPEVQQAYFQALAPKNNIRPAGERITEIRRRRIKKESTL